MSEAQQEKEKLLNLNAVEYADDSFFIQMNIHCFRLFIHFYVIEGRFYGLEVYADETAPVVIRTAPAMVERLRHPHGWFLQLKDAVTTVGLTFEKGFDTAKLLVNDRIGQMLGLMDTYDRVWRAPISAQNKCRYMNGAVWSRGRWSLHLLHLNKPLRDALDGAQASMLSIGKDSASLYQSCLQRHHPPSCQRDSF